MPFYVAHIHCTLLSSPPHTHHTYHTHTHTHTHTLPVICQLEASGKWPDELEAIRKIKTAFYIKMHKLLGQGGVMSSPTVDCIDILMVCVGWWMSVCMLLFACECISRLPLSHTADLSAGWLRIQTAHTLPSRAVPDEGGIGEAVKS